MTETQVFSFLGRLAEQVADEFSIDQLLDRQVKLIAKSWSAATDDDLTTMIEIGIALIRLRAADTEATRQMRSLLDRLKVKCR
jgi:hypothetical protein